jgi:hypothetical protein
MTDVGVLLGGDRNETEQAMFKVVELEQKIALVSENLRFTGNQFNYGNLLPASIASHSIALTSYNSIQILPSGRRQLF